MDDAEYTVLYTPSTHDLQHSHMACFLDRVNKIDPKVQDWPTLHQWSIKENDVFWQQCADYVGFQWRHKPSMPSANQTNPPYRCFFPDGMINFTELCLRGPDTDTILIEENEAGTVQTWDRQALRHAVWQLASWLQNQGIKSGDVVAGILPNQAHAIIAHLAAASIGAIWSSCAVEFGVAALESRLSQIQPKILIYASYYLYRGKRFSQIAKLQKLRDTLASDMIFLSTDSATSKQDHDLGGFSWQDVCDHVFERDLQYEAFPFSHPLVVVFSSGTTGNPKCIVHGAGNVLLQHMKEHQLHLDMHPKNRLFYFSSCGWMMWNWQLSALASGACLVLYDGAPTYPDQDRLFAIAARHHVSHFGVGASYLDALQQHKTTLQHFTWPSLTHILSTGSPLSPACHRYCYDNVRSTFRLESISGGTDILSCFVLGNPLLPIRAGVMTSSGLGMDVCALKRDGTLAEASMGELACANACPSMPLYFWHDHHHKTYHDAYFQANDNTWWHGDYIRPVHHHGWQILGRSDTTLNPRGVRIGTAEIYNSLQLHEDIKDAAAIMLPHDGQDVFVLFVVLVPGLQLDTKRCHGIKTHICQSCSPRHVPDIILQAPELPRTHSGKLMEKIIRQCCLHQQPQQDAVTNPACLLFFRTVLSQLKKTT